MLSAQTRFGFSRTTWAALTNIVGVVPEAVALAGAANVVGHCYSRL